MRNLHLSYPPLRAQPHKLQLQFFFFVTYFGTSRTIRHRFPSLRMKRSFTVFDNPETSLHMAMNPEDRRITHDAPSEGFENGNRAEDRYRYRDLTWNILRDLVPMPYSFTAGLVYHGIGVPLISQELVLALELHTSFCERRWRSRNRTLVMGFRPLRL